MQTNLPLFGIMGANVIDPGAGVDAMGHDDARPQYVENGERFDHSSWGLVFPKMALQLVLFEGLFIEVVNGVDRYKQDCLRASLDDVGVELIAACNVLHF